MSISFLERFESNRLDRHGTEHLPALEEAVRATPADAVVGLDLRGLRYLGFSYAKRTIRELMLRRQEGAYGDRRFFLITTRDLEFLDGLSEALALKGLFMLASEDPDPLSAPWLVGDVSEIVEETFQALGRGSPVATGSLAKLLGQTPQATKRRLDRFEAMGLLQREKVTSPTGGLEWENHLL